jgi:hypothetical protein
MIKSIGLDFYPLITNPLIFRAVISRNLARINRGIIDLEMVLFPRLSIKTQRIPFGTGTPQND